jgi:hypothetical protein
MMMRQGRDRMTRIDRFGPRAPSGAGRTLRLALGAGSLAAFLGMATSAWAKDKAVGVYVEGPGAQDVRDALAGAVPRGESVVDADAFSEALSAQGQKGPFAKKLDGKAHDASVGRIRSAASTLGLEAVLVARVTKGHGKRRIRMFVVAASGGEQELRDVVLEAGDEAASDSTLSSRVHEAFDSYKESSAAAEPKEAKETKESPKATGEAPAVPADNAAAEVVPVGEESKDTVSHRPHGVMSRSLFDADIGAEAAGRNFDYNDGLSGNLRSYNVAPAALFTASLEIFPLAEADGVIRDIGVIAAYSRSLFLNSSTGSGDKIGTAEASYYGGLRVRIHPWGDDGTIIGISDAYAVQTVTFDSTGGTLDSQVPAVEYHANRTGVDARIPFGNFAVRGGLGFRAVFDAGPVAGRFRTPSVEGVDAEVGASMKIIGAWEGRLTLDYARYFYGFKPAPGDAYVAGGALDQFFGGGLALAYVF